MEKAKQYRLEIAPDSDARVFIDFTLDDQLPRIEVFEEDVDRLNEWVTVEWKGIGLRLNADDVREMGRAVERHDITNHHDESMDDDDFVELFEGVKAQLDRFTTRKVN